jgi:RNA polymerase sigma factor (sigma-70 family)
MSHRPETVGPFPVAVASGPDWEPIYRRHYAGSVRLAGMLVGDYHQGEEIAQDAFARLIEAGSKVDNPPAYLRATVVNLARSRLRRTVLARRRPPTPDLNQPGADDGIERVGAASAVRSALSRLPLRQREAVVLRFFGELPLAEVAATMGVSEGAVKTHLHRGLAGLAPSLEALR